MQFKIHQLKGNIMMMTWDPDDASLAAHGDSLLTVAFHIPERPYFMVLPTLSSRTDGKFIYRLPRVLRGHVDVYAAFGMTEGCPETSYELAGHVSNSVQSRCKTDAKPTTNQTNTKTKQHEN